MLVIFHSDTYSIQQTSKKEFGLRSQWAWVWVQVLPFHSGSVFKETLNLSMPWPPLLCNGMMIPSQRCAEDQRRQQVDKAPDWAQHDHTKHVAQGYDDTLLSGFVLSWTLEPAEAEFGNVSQVGSLPEPNCEVRWKPLTHLRAADAHGWVGAPLRWQLPSVSTGTSAPGKVPYCSRSRHLFLNLLICNCNYII